MKEKMKVIIGIEVDGVKLALTEDAAKELFFKLKELFDKPTTYVYPYTYPNTWTYPLIEKQGWISVGGGTSSSLTISTINPDSGFQHL